MLFLFRVSRWASFWRWLLFRRDGERVLHPSSRQRRFKTVPQTVNVKPRFFRTHIQSVCVVRYCCSFERSKKAGAMAQTHMYAKRGRWEKHYHREMYEVLGYCKDTRCRTYLERPPGSDLRTSTCSLKATLYLAPDKIIYLNHTQRGVPEPMVDWCAWVSFHPYLLWTPVHTYHR